MLVKNSVMYTTLSTHVSEEFKRTAHMVFLLSYTSCTIWHDVCVGGGGGGGGGGGAMVVP